MASKLRVAAFLAYLAILCSTGAHVAGLLTDFWVVGSFDIEGSEIEEVHVGLWHKNVKFSNGTEVETETSQLRKEVQFIVIAVAGTNALMCLVVLFKSIHVCVGIIAFIVLSLMILCAFYTFEGISSQRDRLQEINSDWPELALSWSFYLVFLGLIVHIVSTLIFLACLLIRGEMKAEKSKLGQFKGHHDDKTPIVSTVSSDSKYAVNYAYNAGSNSAHAQWVTDLPSASGHALPSSVPDAVVELDNMHIEKPRNSSAQPRLMQSNNSVPKSSRDSSGFTEVKVKIESIRL